MQLASRTPRQYPAPPGPPFGPQPPMPVGRGQDLLFTRGLVLVQVDPELPDVKLQAQERAVWALRLAEPQERGVILSAVEADLNSDINYDAMLAALRLSKPQMAVLHAGYMARPLRALVLEQPPRQDPQAVGIALVREAVGHGRYLSIGDVWSLALSAATERARRTPGGLDHAQLRSHAIRLYDACILELQMGSLTRETDPWLNRKPGPIEAYLLTEFQCQGDRLSHAALPALLMAPARWLQDCLEQAGTAQGWASQAKWELGTSLKNAFEQLLSQSFALGEDAPQALYEAFQHRVCAALDQLGFPNTDPVGTPSAELLQSIGFMVGQHDSDANRLSPEQMAVLRDDFRASPLRRLICDKATPLSFEHASIDALVQEVIDYRGHLSSREAGTLVGYAAAEIVRRASTTTQSLVWEELHRRVTNAAQHRFQGRPPERWEDSQRRLGRIETQVVVQIQRGMALETHALPLLLIASARCLDELLGMCSDVPEERHVLATAIQNAFERLLAQSFALGANAPQDLHGTFVPLVREALDRLGHGARSAVSSPTHEKLQAIGFIPRQVQVSNRGAEQRLANPVPLTIDTTAQSKKRSATQMDEADALVWPVEPSRRQISDAAQAAIDARARLSTRRELQQDLLCLMHAYRNGWLQFGWMHHHDDGFPPFDLSAEPTAGGMELFRVVQHRAPDGYHMKVVRWTRAQCNALMEVIEKHLDLAIVFHGNTCVKFGDEERLGHFTSVIQVANDDGSSVFFELDSLPMDNESGIRWIQSLQDFFGRARGGVLMAIRGNPDNPLLRYESLLAHEPFRRLCEAFGFVLGKQPIVDLAKRYAQPQDLNAEFAAGFLRTQQGFENARSEFPMLEHGWPRERSKAIVNWLDTLGTRQAILFTGVDPMVMAVTRGPHGWVARVVGEGSSVNRFLIDVLDAQQALVNADSRNSVMRGAPVEALVWGPPVAYQASPAGPVQSGVRPLPPLLPPATAQAQAPTPEAIRESQRELMAALTTYPFEGGSIMAAAARTVANLSFDEAIGGLRRMLGAKQFGVLITMAGKIKMSQQMRRADHLVMLYLLLGTNPAKQTKKLLSLMPREMPPCFISYEKEIKDNINRWPAEVRKPVMEKLDLL